jgi:hypothetical protein
MPDHQSIGLGVAGMRTITVGYSFGTQTELFRLLLAGPANDHIQKNKAVFLAYHPVFLACGYFVAMLANEFHVCRIEQAPYPKTSIRKIIASDTNQPKPPSRVPSMRNNLRNCVAL